MQRRSFMFRNYGRQLLLLVVVGAGLYVVIPQVGTFHSSWHLLQHPRLTGVVVAMGFIGVTYIAAATTYYWLAFKPLIYRQVLLVQLAAMFVNRLLPGGIGAIGANYAYLRQQRHTAAQAACVAAVNNLWGFIGHGLVVAVTLLLFSVYHLPLTASPTPVLHPWNVAIVAGVVLLAGGMAALNKDRLSRGLADITQQLLSYRQRPRRLGLALVSSIALTLNNILALAACASALNVSLSFAAIVLVFTFGVGAGTATPTPGGLGGFEAGIAAGLIAYHVAGPAALAVALLYRLLSYWLPLIAGGLAFAVCQRRRLFG